MKYALRGFWVNCWDKCRKSEDGSQKKQASDFRLLTFLILNSNAILTPACSYSILTA